MGGGLLVDEEEENEKYDGYLKYYISSSISLSFDHHIKSYQSSSYETKSTNNHITRREIRSIEEYEMFSYLDLIISISFQMDKKEDKRDGQRS